jgi:hypothetical protein
MTILLAALLTIQAANEEVAAAAKKAAETTSYSFKVSSPAPAKGKGAGGTVEGKYEKDQPVALKSGALEAFRKGGLVVYKEGEEWKRAERKKGERRADPTLALQAVKLPHEELDGFDKYFQSIAKAEQKENDCAVFSGPLTDTAAASLSATGAKGNKAAAALKFSGTGKVWVNADGRIVKYEVQIKGTGERNGKTVDQSIHRTVELTDLGSAKVEIPEGAKKALEAQS